MDLANLFTKQPIKHVPGHVLFGSSIDLAVQRPFRCETPHGDILIYDKFAILAATKELKVIFRSLERIPEKTYFYYKKCKQSSKNSYTFQKSYIPCQEIRPIFLNF